jgi:hypothetical protein
MVKREKLLFWIFSIMAVAIFIFSYISFFWKVEI